MIRALPILQKDHIVKLSNGLLLCALLLWVTPVLAAESPSGITPFQLNTFAANCLNLLKSGNSAALASQFHLDPRMSEAERQRERDELLANLEAVSAEFGLPDAAVALEEPREAHQFVLQGLTSAYWNQFSRYHPASYQIRYAGAGTGYLTFAIVVYDRRLQLRAVAFGLPVELPGSEARLKDLVDRIQATARKTP